jgi:hypothetical protein
LIVALENATDFRVGRNHLRRACNRNNKSQNNPSQFISSSSPLFVPFPLPFLFENLRTFFYVAA